MNISYSYPTMPQFKFETKMSMHLNGHDKVMSYWDMLSSSSFKTTVVLEFYIKTFVKH